MFCSVDWKHIRFEYFSIEKKIPRNIYDFIELRVTHFLFHDGRCKASSVISTLFMQNGNDEPSLYDTLQKSHRLHSQFIWVFTNWNTNTNGYWIHVDCGIVAFHRTNCFKFTGLSRIRDTYLPNGKTLRIIIWWHPKRSKKHNWTDKNCMETGESVNEAWMMSCTKLVFMYDAQTVSQARSFVNTYIQ